MDIILYREAKNKGLKHYYTGKPCNRGHIDRRLTSSTTCCTCARENHYTMYAKHRDKALAAIKSWSRKNNDVVAEISRKYRANNPETHSKTSKKYYNANKQKKLAYNKWWRAVNNDKQLAYNAKRRAQIKQALPAWADVDKINQIYTQSVELSTSTGISHHVDHIVPLCGELVCGLHVHENLQVLVRGDNLSKGNKFTV